MGAGRTDNTVTVEKREGDQEPPGYAQRSFATRSNYVTRQELLVRYSIECVSIGG